MAIENGFRASQRGKKITTNSSEESKWLKLILDAIENEEGIESAILTALGGGIAVYNTFSQYDLLSADTQAFLAGTIHSISFQVIKGSTTVSFDGGSTFTTYPVGSNVNLEASTLISTEIDFLVSGIALDGSNEVLIQVNKI